jgi:hypothetical protein
VFGFGKLAAAARDTVISEILRNVATWLASYTDPESLRVGVSAYVRLARHDRTFDIYHAPSNALINLAIKDAIAREESSCIKCFP